MVVMRVIAAFLLVSASGACSSDACDPACLSDQRCVGGRCRVICEVDAGCASDEICVRGLCELGNRIEPPDGGGGDAQPGDPPVGDPVAGDSGDPESGDPVVGDPVVGDPAGDPLPGDPPSGDPPVGDPFSCEDPPTDTGQCGAGGGTSSGGLDIQTAVDITTYRVSRWFVIDGDLTITNTGLTGLRGLDCIREITGDLIIQYNGCLTALDELRDLETIGGSLVITHNPVLPQSNVDGFAVGLSVGGSTTLTPNGS